MSELHNTETVAIDWVYQIYLEH